MTNPLSGPPDWRSRVAGSGRNEPYVAGSGRNQPSDPRRAPSNQFVITGRVISESEAPWLHRAAGTRPLAFVLLVAVLLAALASGVLASIMAGVVAILLPFLLLFVLVAYVAGRIPGLRFLGGLASFGAWRARPPRAAAATVPGRQLLVSTADGRTEELMVASARRFPAGTEVTAFGPQLAGRRHVWAIRPTGHTFSWSRGVLPLMVFGAVAIPMIFLFAIAGLS